MRTLSKYNNETMKKILALLGEGQHIKIENNKTFMPLVVENIGSYHGHENAISLAHYGEQNGDLMRDPEMIFVESDGSYAPVYFRNDYAGVEQEAFTYDEQNNVAGLKLKAQISMSMFAEIWLRNIKHQQEL